MKIVPTTAAMSGKYKGSDNEFEPLKATPNGTRKYNDVRR